MVDLVEARPNVGFEHPVIGARPRGQVVDLGDCVLRPPIRPKPVRARKEVRLEYGFEHQFDRCLYHPVGDGGDTQRPQLAAGLGDHHPPYRNRSDPARLQRVPYLLEELRYPDLGLDPRHRDAIDSRCPRPGVPGHALPRADQERRIVDEVEKVLEPAGRILARPTVQLQLHPPYHGGGLERLRSPRGAGIHQRFFGHCIPSIV